MAGSRYPGLGCLRSEPKALCMRSLLPESRSCDGVVVVVVVVVVIP